MRNPQNRIYLVGHGQTMRLVRASNRAQALSHVARSVFNVKVAGQDELIYALAVGTKVEAAVEMETEQLPFPENAAA